MTTDTIISDEMQRRISTIQKLLNQAQCEGSTLAESEAFMGMRQKLIEKYNITEAMLKAEAKRQAKEQGPAEGEEITQSTVYTRSKGKMPSWVLLLANGVSYANRCKYYYSSSRRHGSLGAYGTAANLESFKLLMPFLIGEVDRLYQEEKPSTYDLAREAARRRTTTRGEGKRWATSFRQGCANRIASRLREARKEAAEEMKAQAKMTREERYAIAMEAGDTDTIMQLDREDPEKHKYALAKVESALAILDDEEKRTVDKFDERFGDRKGRSINSYGSRHAGYQAGQAAGNRASINGPKGWVG